MAHRITAKELAAYRAFLEEAEKSPATIKKYLRDIQMLKSFLKGGKMPPAYGEKTKERTPQTEERGRADAPVYVDKEAVIRWKQQLLQNHAPATVNGMLSAANGLFRFLGWGDCRVRFLKVQRRMFRDPGRQLEKGEYLRLLQAAQARGQGRLSLLMETLCATGIRVSELAYITVEAACSGCARITLKGKIRTILLPGKLCRKLNRYAKKQGVKAGPVFCTRNGRPLSRGQIWAQMKALCAVAGVAPSKVFPHNLRRLFAAAFYKVSRDIVRLADILGHSSIETTRLYLLSTEGEELRRLNRMGLVQ